MGNRTKVTDPPGFEKVRAGVAKAEEETDLATLLGMGGNSDSPPSGDPDEDEDEDDGYDSPDNVLSNPTINWAQASAENAAEDRVRERGGSMQNHGHDEDDEVLRSPSWDYKAIARSNSRR